MSRRKQRKEKKDFGKIYLNPGVVQDAYLFNQADKISNNSHLNKVRNFIFKITYQGALNLFIFIPYLSKNTLLVVAEKATEYVWELIYSLKSRSKSNQL